jgi:CubicO group peptidase (beta-lactamase class C family)
VAAWGDVERRFKCHSIRKSLLSSLYGVYVTKGLLDINRSLGSLGITDWVELTALEKTAKVSDLLKTRSGVYLEAALEGENTRRPARGSHPPGTFQYYNNWDFNVLGSIFRQEAKQDIFEAFKREIADRLGMQDFRTMDGAYEYEGKSRHPGYPFKMSARDLARFGQLYLQRGRWNDEQILDPTWIDASFTPYTSAPDMGNGATGYGYLWWIQERPGEPRRFFALGWGEQYLGLFPDQDLAIVVRSDSYFGDYLNDEAREHLVGLIVASKTGHGRKNPRLVPLPPRSPGRRLAAITPDRLRAFVGRYTLAGSTLANVNSSFTLEYVDSALVVEGLHYAYRFRLLPMGDNQFFIEDIDLQLSFDRGEDGRPTNPRIRRAAESVTPAGKVS